MSNQNMVELIDVSGDIILEVVKAVIFKHLIQIDRSVNSTEGQIHRTLVYWLKIESIAIAKMSKGNRYLLNKLNSIMDYLNG